MIPIFFLNFIILVFGLVFSFLPEVTTLPTIAGFDIDTALSSGISMMYALFHTYWPLLDMFYAFLALMSYYSIKLVAKIFLGSHSPTL